MSENAAGAAGAEAAAGCFNTTWEAVQSIEGVRIWQSALERTGLNLVMDDPEYRGIIFVVLDDGVTGCNTDEVYDTSVWPQGDCGSRQRDWMSLLTMDVAGGGNSLLMYHWLPGLNATDDDQLATGELHPTLLNTLLSTLSPASEATEGYAGTGEMYAGLLFLDDQGVALPAGIPVVDSSVQYPGGYRNATVVDQRNVCNLGPTVKVLDRVVYPKGLPSVPATAIPELAGYCHDSMYTGMQEAGRFELPARLAIATYVHPFLSPMLNPASSITLFSPKFEGEWNLIEQGLVPGNRSSIRDLVAIYPMLMSFKSVIKLV